MKPQNENNFIVELTPEQFDNLKLVYRHVDDSTAYEVLYYSPYWKEMNPSAQTLPSEREDAIE